MPKEFIIHSSNRTFNSKFSNCIRYRNCCKTWQLSCL